MNGTGMIHSDPRATFQDLVTEFHAKFKRAIGSFIGDNFADENQRKLRAALVLEEALEFVEACGFDPETLDLPLRSFAKPGPDFPGAIDALADLLYVTFGSAVTFGVSMTIPFKVVHKSNMAKTGGGANALGKILKPEGWKPPDIDGTLRDMGWKPNVSEAV